MAAKRKDFGQTNRLEDKSGSEVEDDDPITEALEVEVDNGASEPPAKRFAAEEDRYPKGIASKIDLYKQPTREELNVLKENETLYRSNLYRLQIDELLSEVRLKESRKTAFRKWFSSFQGEIKSLEKSIACKLTDHLRPDHLAGVKPPVPPKLFCDKGMFQFFPPEDVVLVGSFPLDVTVKSTANVDVMLRMPKQCFYKDDYLNHRCRCKQALYLAHIAKEMKSSELVQEGVQFSYLHGDPLKPVLKIKPKGKLGNHIVVNVLAAAPAGIFKLSRFGPNRNNLRSALNSQSKEATGGVARSTPYYNSNMLMDLTMESSATHLVNLIGQNQNVRDGILLLKVWLHQRELDEGYGSMSGFIMTMFVAHLLQTKQINPLMSSFQILRKTLLGLTQFNWMDIGISMVQQEQDQQPTLASFLSVFPVVFVDPSGFLNLCANMNEPTYLRVLHEAEISLKFLEDAQSFQSLFMMPVKFSLKYDQFVRITGDLDMKSVFKKCKLLERTGDLPTNIRDAILPRVVQVLKESLGPRVTLIDVRREKPLKWSVEERPPDTQTVDITIGMLLDLQYSNSILDKGPQADSVEAKEYRAFWGKKSEMRQFKDGGIVETVVWSNGQTLAEKRLICSRIVRYVLGRHAGISKRNIAYVGHQLDRLISLPYPKTIRYGTGEEAMTTIVQSLDELAKQLRDLDVGDAALNISSVRGTSASFRFTEVFPPLPCSCSLESESNIPRQGNHVLPKGDIGIAPKWIQTLEVLINIEGTTKWPKDIEGLKRIKAGVYLKLSDKLSEKHKLSCMAMEDCLEILKDGYVFRVQATHQKEAKMLKMEHTADGVVRFRDNKSSVELEKKTELLPKLTGALHGVQSLNNTYSATCRLAKRWVASQLLADYVADLAVELVTAYVYLNPSPYSPPSSPLVAFQRVLTLLSTFDWKTTPLIVNLNEELKPDEVVEITSKFSTNRCTLPSMFIATPFDKFGSVWTKKVPTNQMLVSVARLATASLAMLEQQLAAPRLADFRQIFRPPLSQYDVLIHLKPLQNSKRHLAVDLDAKTTMPATGKLRDTKGELIPFTGIDYVQCYLTELRDAFDEFAFFFHDRYGGSFIAVVWKVPEFAPQPFKTSQINCRMLRRTIDAGKGQATTFPNMAAMLDDFSILGHGLVKGVEVLAEKWTIE